MITWLSVILLTFSSLLNKKVSETHDFHTSLTEININTKSKTLEISIRLFTDDFETELSSLNSNKKILVDGDDDATQSQISKYIRKNFAFISKNNEVIFPEYLGKETEKEATWIYLDMPIPNNISELFIYNNLLNASFGDQTNMVTVIKNEEKKSFLFNKNDKTFLFPF